MKKSEKIILSIVIAVLSFNLVNLLIYNLCYQSGKEDVHVVLLEKTTTPHVVTHKSSSTIAGTDRWFMVSSKKYGFGEFKVGLNDYMRYDKGDGIIYELDIRDLENYFGVHYQYGYCEDGFSVFLIFFFTLVFILILLIVSVCNDWID